MERRFTQQAQSNVALETREDKPTQIVGYASVYYNGTRDTEYELWPGVLERIMPGAFDTAIRDDDVRGLFNHNPDNLLGRTSAKTLGLASDKVGLRYANDVAETTVSRDVQEHIRRGDLQGSSFSFQARSKGENWIEEKDSDGHTFEIREITDIRLFDVGPVTFPAYGATTTGIRSADNASEARASYEKWLEEKKNAGLQGRLAGYKARAIKINSELI